VQDEPASVAGGALGPTPTDYFVVALGACQNVVFVRFAALELRIESLETTVTGVWDRRGLYGIAGVDPGFQEITLETRVTTRHERESRRARAPHAPRLPAVRDAAPGDGADCAAHRQRAAGSAVGAQAGVGRGAGVARPPG
jgi:hypothetical protein